MIHRISILAFLAQATEHLVIDVRSPLEFAQGHIPGATNIAIFSDEERAVIGTLYKQVSQQAAVLQGLQLFGPKLVHYVQVVEKLTDKKSIFIYCFRGGMRSASFAWLLSLYGYEVFLLEGGYKAYRIFALEQCNKKLNIIVLSGKTGSGKTNLLNDYTAQGKQVVDLEGLACHKGSVFGGIGRMQPTQEQFENNLVCVLNKLSINELTWIEDESRKIGKMVIPVGLWSQMRSAPIQFLEKTKQERLNLIMEEYGIFSTQEFLDCLLRLKKHLGSQRYSQAKELLLQNNRIDFFALLIDYYDKAYDTCFEKRSCNNTN